MTEAQIKKLFDGCTTEKTVYARLKRHNLPFTDARALGECEYFNIRIPCDYGTIRIYNAGHGVMQIQHFRPVKMEYSGIPVFFATDSMF